jgi:Tol biopolymer transport system component
VFWPVSILEMRGMNLRCCFVTGVLLAVISGCLPTGEDSWQHYSGGGFYPARTPCMSPDGTVIVFSSPCTGNGDIYQIRRDGSNRIRLTSHPAFETDPIFSPDGSTIAFTREVDHRRHIWLMDRDGAKQRQLTSGAVLDDVVSFSPDGSKLNFYRSPLSMGMGRTITAHAADVGSGKVLAMGPLPVYSPDGSKIAYCEAGGANASDEIWIMDADGSNKRFVVSGHSPRFSPEGNALLYSTEHTHPGSLWKICNVDGSNIRELGRMADPVFASDGKRVLCLSPEWRREIWMIHLDGRKRERLQAPTGYIDFFRPCCDGFLFKLVADDRVGDIYVVNTDERTVQRVASMR